MVIILPSTPSQLLARYKSPSLLWLDMYLQHSSFKQPFSGVNKEIGLFQPTRRCVFKLRQVPASPRHHSPLLLYDANGLPYLINPYRFEVARCYALFTQIQHPPSIALFLFCSVFVWEKCLLGMYCLVSELKLMWEWGEKFEGKKK